MNLGTNLEQRLPECADANTPTVMKFGKHLADQCENDWSVYYIEYQELKKLIKVIVEEKAGRIVNVDHPSLSVEQGYSARGLKSSSLEPAESTFIRRLDEELDKVNKFTVDKGAELRRELKSLEKEFGKPGGVDAEEKERRRKECERLGHDLLRLEKFVNLNYTGFRKLLKKHDKFAEAQFLPMFMLKLRNQPFFTSQFGDVLVQLSGLHDKLRDDTALRKKGNEGEFASGGDGANFVRKTTKYWVRIEDVTRIKWMVLQHLPLFQFKQSNTDSDLISSVYFDNDAMELYQGRLDKTPGAIALRLRWYGTGRDGERVIFVERKTHHDGWTGEVSVKTRFDLKEKHVPAFLKGTLDLNKRVEKMRALGKSEKEIAEFSTLWTEIRQAIDAKQLVPKCRTQYYRTAFQIPFDASVRISLDTNLCMISEKFDDKNWCRPSNVAVSPNEICRFPHAVLEVKLQLQLGDELPQWVDELINSGLVLEVPKFSKFIHGCATLMDEDVRALPFWLDTVNAEYEGWDGSKPQAAGSSNTAPSATAARESLRRLQQARTEINGKLKQGTTRSDMIEPLIPAESTAATTIPQPASQAPTKRRTVQSQQKWWEQWIPWRSNPYDKPLKVPVRVEPKTYFANERTFLSWLNMSVLMSSVAVGLIGLGGDTAASSYGGVVLLVVGLFFAVYAIGMFHWRANKIRARDGRPYDDRFGPTVLVTGLISALIFNFVITWQSTTINPR